MGSVLFENAAVFDGESPRLGEGMNVLVEGDRIARITDAPIDSADERIDCTGKTLMPGLIDCHVHVYAADMNLGAVNKPSTYYAHFARQFLDHSLRCGFTTVRDVAGGDHGLAMAIDKGLLVAPRYVYGGLALSQTGGHGDLRPSSAATRFCSCGAETTFLAILADGVDACIKAVREELRKGASHIKIMGSGGVMSPSDPIDRCQYSDAEILAIVDECARRGAYVAAHCHPDEAIRRCTELGVRSIEHATMATRPTADLMVEKGAFAVPTFATMAALKDSGREMGVGQKNLDKLDEVYDYAREGLGIMQEAGVSIAFGTDLLAGQHVRQCSEFTLRAEVQANIDILRSATSVSAALLCMEQELGYIRPGYLADIIVVDGNPLEDIALLAADGRALHAIMREGRLVKSPTA